MFRGRYGGTLLLLVLVAAAALAVVAIADDADASWSGEPVPPWGNDWYISQDTVYTDETIRMNGNIYVFAPFTLSLDGCTLIFNCSYDGEHGLMPDWGSVLYINDSASNDGIVMSNTSSAGWWFEIYGEAYLNDVDLMDIYYGIWNWNTYLYMEGCTVTSTIYGIMSFTDGHIGNTTINVIWDTWWWGTGYVEAIGVMGQGGTLGLYDLAINIMVDINDTISPTSYFYGDYYIYGIYLYSTDVGRLQPSVNGEFSVSIDLNVDVHNWYDTTGYATFYNYVYTRAIYMSGSTICRAVNDIDLDITENLAWAAHNASMGARVIVYNYQDYFYSTISSSGMAPTEISGITLDGVGVKSNVIGTVYSLSEYWYNYGFYIGDSDGAQPGDEITVFHDISIRNSRFDYTFVTPRYGEWWMHDCTFENLVARRVIDMYYCDTDFTVSSNLFRNIVAMEDYTDLFRIYRTEGQGLLNWNTFEDIEGWRMFYIYYPDDRVYFENNNVTNNNQWDYVYDPWFYIYQSQDRVFFRWNTFNDSSYVEGLMNTYYTQEKVTWEGNVIENNMFGDYMLRTYYNYNDVEFSENEVKMNAGPLFQLEQVRGRWTMADNLFQGNEIGADYMLFTYYIYQELKFTDNVIDGNSADGELFLFRGVTYWSSIDFTFDRNTITNNVVSSAMNGGILVFRGVRYDVAVRRNTFVGNTGTCINFYRPFSSNSWYTTYTHTVDGNVFNNNDGAATTWIDYRSYNIIVKRNTGTNNTGPLMMHTLTDRYVYDYYYPDCYGEMTGAYSIEVSSNNYSYNKAGAIEINPAQWVDANTPYNNRDQVVWLSNNILQHNGDGWAIRVVNFGHFPVLVNNDVYGSKYGTYLHAINYISMWPRVKLTFTGESYDGGGPGGMTAWGLVNVDADFTDCTFTNFQEALYARDCTINVYWSAIPEGSGRTEGRGYIYVFNHLEILITWSDAMGVDSGMPAIGGTLALLGTNGRYYGAMEVDEDGRIGPMLVMPWSSIEGKMDQWSPYDGTILAGDLTAEETIHVIGEQVGDDSLHLIIQDSVVPEIVVTSPSMGAMSNMVDMPVEGFLFETGSGIGSFMGYIDGGTGMEVDPMLTWTTMFNDLGQGEHTIMFEASDISGNMANATVTFLIDSLAPDLSIVEPSNMYVTRESNLLVQGTYQDDVSDLSEIEVRVNGRVLSSTTGVINEYETLTEGVNTIIIDATDAAGNMAVVRRTVTLDTYPPTLYVYSPLNMLVTAEPTLMVSGLSEAGTPILIEQVRASNGELISSSTVDARPDGTFRTTLTLMEGDQHIVFTAEDSAENVRSLTRTVTLDTTPPGLTINSPQEGAYVADSSVPLVAQVTDNDLESVRVLVNGLPVEHAGLISKTIPLVEGMNTIVVIAIDAVDNQVTRSVNVTRDTIPPMLTVENPEFVLTNERILTVRGMVNDDASVVTVAGSPVNVDEDLGFTKEIDLSVADNPIMVVATDMAGNEVMVDITFIYDNEKPVIDLIDPPEAKTSDLVITLAGTITDNVATVQKVTVMGQVYPVIDGKFNVLVVVDTAGDGWNNFTISAVDDAGNEGVYKVNVQYEPQRDDTEISDGPETSMLWYYGILLIIAAFVILVTVFIFAKRGEEE